MFFDRGSALVFLMVFKPSPHRRDQETSRVISASPQNHPREYPISGSVYLREAHLIPAYFLSTIKPTSRQAKVIYLLLAAIIS